jgi:hypothetical protein
MPYQVLRHDDYLEVRLEGVVEAALDFDAPPFSGAQGARVLVDYAAVTDVRADAYALAEQAHRAEAAGFKVAVFAPRLALFGLNRQALQLGGVQEGISAGVFSDLDEARAWLRAG